MSESWPVSGQVRCEDAQQTQQLGERIGQAVRAGDVLILDGPLGAGKTTLTQGIARGMGISARVTSPTFTIAREYHPGGDAPALIHVDAYRLMGGQDAGPGDALDALESLDLDAQLDSAVVVAEWGKGMFDVLSQRCWLVTIDRTTAVEQDPDSQARLISWHPVGVGEAPNGTGAEPKSVL
ncbi:tRNA (adenosine(37)-N6)-threonylcarbamoyltransferase complex ATPase subunit type 1 TsaE [Corynebacterium uberis]|uniref:tRNA (adenosine(37)-N6)-threonylcarbamoyltransferase complex ATPase subunit type 1 TsaE n=1 Tax=Corynebacterium TaxID=1716 RepID=UPI001D09A109|nr:MULTISPECIES: tRNA (adenosine(37)-N6)-threonylcarbamoyltransferase complex ATPase subunit type 1 TsaE [Corynebacterium]MCZ9309351.1 tRNA (adenosine(37)-N6)-threonylcarbamoyltransferase complex ATPase subunit type 1 TsaE [Corynebacterium sp. c6VSa_13]UDL72900.1 tRNA (adenosine(37)-N6)-threonylcarbamoyltransferase complex ATPase subunit type 1 TsaE [Corynebacterium uberis]UDL76223.1 tRNA (adenosine(37)-N6)-threonylcarbamoyltransferase complex ATPase subunit type 1 TsaE [Corynebacterium uberis]